jgi:S-adenosyl-L-methionine hydrolase (adenosine-forming)
MHPWQANGIVAVTTDFGLRDPYVGIMSGVMLGINANARIVDVTHHVAPQDVAHGSFVLASAAAAFPAGTVHLAVVDPGVGGKRRAIAMRTSQQLFVAPDNGLLSDVMDADQDFVAVELSNPEYFRAEVSQTFHGRDIFAPVAAHLSLGVDIDALGERVTNPLRLRTSQPEIAADGVKGSVRFVDHFGNIVTNIPGSLVSTHDAEIALGDLRIQGLANAYETAAEGRPLAIVNSYGLVEIAVRGGNAAARLGARRGTAITIRFTG